MHMRIKKKLQLLFLPFFWSNVFHNYSMQKRSSISASEPSTAVAAMRELASRFRARRSSRETRSVWVIRFPTSWTTSAGRTVYKKNVSEGKCSLFFGISCVWSNPSWIRRCASSRLSFGGSNVNSLSCFDSIIFLSREALKIRRAWRPKSEAMYERIDCSRRKQRTFFRPFFLIMIYLNKWKNGGK